MVAAGNQRRRLQLFAGQRTERPRRGRDHHRHHGGDVLAVASNCPPAWTSSPGQHVTSALEHQQQRHQHHQWNLDGLAHVARVAALVSQASANASPAAVSSFLVQNASVNKISSIGTGSPNLLLFSLADGSATRPAVIPVAIARGRHFEQERRPKQRGPR